jgi:hypothetical protein
MFATIKLVTAPVVHGDSGVFDVKSVPGAVCHIQRSGGGHSARSGANFTIGSTGENASVHAGGSADSGGSWSASPTGYTVTAVCTMPAPDNRTATSAAITPPVVWP